MRVIYAAGRRSANACSFQQILTHITVVLCLRYSGIRQAFSVDSISDDRRQTINGLLKRTTHVANKISCNFNLIQGSEWGFIKSMKKEHICSIFPIFRISFQTKQFSFYTKFTQNIPGKVLFIYFSVVQTVAS